MAVSLPSARRRGRECAIPGVVDVWRVDLSRAEDDWLRELLCPEERARAARIVHARKRALWARSRGVLRELLGRYLDADPPALGFELGTHGKPHLRSEPRETLRDSGSYPREDLRLKDLRFNLSHAGELMLVAVTAGREVGVDVERARERYADEFLRAWTLREARVKCLGTGLAAMPVAGGGSAGEELWTTELGVGPRALAAIALAGGEEWELRCRDWPG